jgi:CheY-like chemotaxis protein
VPALLEKPGVASYNAGMEIIKGEGTILLVDDQDLVIDVGRDMISMLGYTVLTAKSGEEALAVFQEHKDVIQLVVLDYMLPGMSGSEIYDRLAAIQPAVRVLVSSGYSKNGEAAALLEKGCLSYIQKPFSLVELSRKIHDALHTAA